MSETRAAADRRSEACSPGAARLTVVGIGADGWEGLGPAARAALREATLIVGSARQLALVPPTGAERRPWPSPIDGLLDELVAGAAGPACVLASGDPMLHGIGATLARRVEAGRLTVHPHVSAFALACARLGWPEAETELLSTLTGPAAALASGLQPGRRLIVFPAGAGGAGELAGVLRDRGFGPSRFVVLERLGGPRERRVECTADGWGERPADPLHAVAIECRPAEGALVLGRGPGLPDEAYESDGQITKREIRAVTLAALAPMPGALLWDVGAGSGSIGIEWLRAEPLARAVAIEARPDRAGRAARNAARLGVPRLDVRCGRAPELLAELDRPHVIFVGGGLTAPGLVPCCWERLAPGGRIVANAVTLEGEQVLQRASSDHGGRLARISVSHAEPIGGFTAWREQRPIVQWAATKELA